MVRQTFVGKLQRDNQSIVRILKDGIIEAKKMFFEANYIDDKDVLSIKNDADNKVYSLFENEVKIIKILEK